MLRLLVLLLAGCGTLASGAGAPENPPASGLGPSIPWDDDTGLDWTAPFILEDPAQAFAHPSAIVEGDSIDLWVEAQRGSDHAIAHATAATFEHGFGSPETTLTATLPWHQGMGSPAVVIAGEARCLFYLSAQKLGLARVDADGSAHLRAQPLFVAPNGAITSIAAARLGDAVRLVLLVDGAIEETAIPLSKLSGDLDADFALSFEPTGISLPAYATSFLEVGLRIESTGAGRQREDLLFAATLPNAADLGTQALPSAIGAASRYLDPPGLAYELAVLPILSGSPAPRGPALVSYRGGTLLLYAARSGPRDAIGVARHP